VYHSILVGQDGSPDSEAALETAMWLSAMTNAHLTLVHLHARKLPLRHDVPTEEVEAMLAEREKRCTDAGIRTTHRVITGWGTHAMATEARWYDLVVVGKRGLSHGQQRDKCGSLTHALMAECPVPLLIADPNGATPQRLLVAFDGSPDACRALRIAVSFVEERGLELRVVESGGGAHLERAREYLADCGVGAMLEVLPGKWFDSVCSYVNEHDVQLCFVPALMGPIIGGPLSQRLVTHTASSVVVPLGRALRVY